MQHNNVAFCFRLNTHNRIVCVRTRRPLEMDLMTHWGVDVISRAEVDRAHDNAQKHKETYGIQKNRLCTTFRRHEMLRWAWL